MFYMLFLVPLIPNDIALFVTLVGLGPRFLDLDTISSTDESLKLDPEHRMHCVQSHLF